MKRSPLNRKTPLKANPDKQLKRTPLKPRSKKAQNLYQTKRIPLVKRLLEERPTCQICEVNDSVDLHEILTRGRSGGIHSGEWLDETNILCVCRLCHNKIDDNPEWAEAHGYIKPSEK
jgi:hypothetical protein